MKIFLLLLFCISIHTVHVNATEAAPIKPSKDYKSYSNEELRQRVWQLELAVQELQKNTKSKAEQPPSTLWTCYIRVFGFFASTDPTKELATQNALEKCRSNTSGLYCKESSVKCQEEQIQK